MRRILFAFGFLLAALMAADRDLAGGYAGQWKSNGSGNGGAIRYTIEPAGDGWKSTLSFDLAGAEVPTAMREVKLQDGKIELVYDFDIQGASLRSKVKGEWNGAEFRGTYETSTTDGSQAVDSGTWDARRKK